MSARASWVIPCYNEAARLHADAFVSLVDDEPEVNLLFVNDGSRDATEERLREMALRRPQRIQILSLDRNVGKAEAVRLGMVEAQRRGTAMVGYFDADLATPTSEIRRLTQVMLQRDVDLVVGARVAMLGRRIDRSNLRHYLGRVFASAASVVLRLRVYDTQCGAKLFRCTPALAEALSKPFISRWVFDVELIGRLIGDPKGIESIRIIEEPLLEWRDVPGSKLRSGHFVAAALDLARVAWALRHLREKRR
jgi:glycosyltransferase involved in cell wall biosynthesis